MIRTCAIVCLAVSITALGGCRSRKATPPPDTGSRAALQTFYNALIEQNWSGAYAQLHAEEQSHLSLAQFTDLAKAYRRDVGFEPARLQIRSCNEQGDTTIGHVVLIGTQSGHQHYRDAISLKNDGSRWGIVLPATFGKPMKSEN